MLAPSVWSKLCFLQKPAIVDNESAVQDMTGTKTTSSKE